MEIHLQLTSHLGSPEFSCVALFKQWNFKVKMTQNNISNNVGNNDKLKIPLNPVWIWLPPLHTTEAWFESRLKPWYTSWSSWSWWVFKEASVTFFSGWLKNIVLKVKSGTFFCCPCPPLYQFNHSKLFFITEHRDVVQWYQPPSQLDGLFIKMKPYLSIKVAVMRGNNPTKVFQCAIFITQCISRGGGRVIWLRQRLTKGASKPFPVSFYCSFIFYHCWSPTCWSHSHPLSVLKHRLSPLFNGQITCLSFCFFFHSPPSLSYRIPSHSSFLNLSSYNK